MAGYAIHARIEGVRPRLTALAAPTTDAVDRAWPAFLADDGFRDPFAGLHDDPAPTLAEPETLQADGATSTRRVDLHSP